jgi:hypothetical protein
MLRILLLTGLLFGCSAHIESTPAKKELPVRGEFRTGVYQLSEFEQVRVIDLPDRVLPTRCWVYTNTLTRTSHMRCDSDSAAELPTQGAPLEQSR